MVDAGKSKQGTPERADNGLRIKTVGCKPQTQAKSHILLLSQNPLCSLRGNGFPLHRDLNKETTAKRVSPQSCDPNTDETHTLLKSESIVLKLES